MGGRVRLPFLPGVQTSRYCLHKADAVLSVPPKIVVIATDGFAFLRKSESVLQIPKRRKSPTPKGVGLFLAVLNLIYISIDAFENTKAKNTLSRNGFRVLNYAQSG